jgi:hypothetical protein
MCDLRSQGGAIGNVLVAATKRHPGLHRELKKGAKLTWWSSYQKDFRMDGRGGPAAHRLEPDHYDGACRHSGVGSPPKWHQSSSHTHPSRSSHRALLGSLANKLLPELVVTMALVLCLSAITLRMLQKTFAQVADEGGWLALAHPAETMRLTAASAEPRPRAPTTPPALGVGRRVLLPTESDVWLSRMNSDPSYSDEEKSGQCGGGAGGGTSAEGLAQHTCFFSSGGGH